MHTTTNTAPALTAERVAELRPVAELFRWARRNGWTLSESGVWQNGRYKAEATIRVGFGDGSVDVYGKDSGRWAIWPAIYPVGCFRQGINVLAALDIIPAEFFVGAKTQLCENCAPGYDCERGIYTPAVAPMSADNRAAMVAAIRALADFVETRTDLPVPNSVDAQHSLIEATPANADTVREAAAALGVEPRISEDSAYVLFDIGRYPASVQYAVHGIYTPAVTR